MGARACLLALLFLACSSEALVPAPDDQDRGAPAATGTPTAAPTGAPPVMGPGAEGFQPVEAYPAGPYGRGVGAVIDNIDFVGWRDPVGADYSPEALERVSLADFYDPSGEHTKLLVVNASALWCTVCQTEMRQIKQEKLYEQYRARGVEFLGTLFEDLDGAPAKPIDLKTWGSSASRAIQFPLVLDPSLRMGVYFTSDATPLNLLIDAQSMRILYAFMGYDGSANGFWSLVDRELEKRGVAPP
jgi:hypothetical protein